MEPPVYAYAKEKYRVKKVVKKNKYRARTGPRCCSNHCPAEGIKKDWLIRRRPQKRYEQTVTKRSALLARKS